MRRFIAQSARVVASALALSLTLSACGSHGGSPLPSTLPQSTNEQPQAVAHDTASREAVATGVTSQVGPLVAVPQLFGSLAYTDAGRRAATAPVSVSLTLAYNHQAELDAFVAAVSDPHSGSYRHFLSAQQFNDYYAPTAAQEQTVVQALQKSGFTITQRFPNRTIVDASAPSASVERFFSTEMHTVRQGKYGERFANLKAVVVPASIASLVRTASLSNVVIARTVADASDIAPHRSAPTFERDSAGRMRVPLQRSDITPADSSGALVNGGFDTGALSPWINESSTQTNHVSISSTHPQAGGYSAYMGTSRGPEVNGWASIAQQVTVPANATLSFWVYQGSNEGSYGTQYAFQAGYLLDSSGNVLTNFYKTVNTTNGWVNYKINLSQYAGQSDYLYFGCYGDGNSSTYVYQYVDSVAWLGSASPTPTPVPTAVPTPTATPKPTATPTASPAPTATPIHTPTPAPTATAAPTATPKPTATPVPTATPTSGTACTGTAPDNGPLSNSSGTLATGVAKPFDFPVQHGCNGSGYTAAVIIDDPVNTSYLNSYLSAAAVTQTGTVTNVAVDGGGSGDEPETDLDVQTIAGLAPGANIIVYDMGSLTDQAIEDAYNKALSDGKASVINSSFGGCESSDTPFESATNSIAQQGASEGVTFAASSGDTGSNECSGKKGVSAPAGDPYFSSIGGVNFTYTAAGVLQSVTAGNASGDSGGGGVSTVVPLPSWQSGIAGVITSGRNQPDISLPFDPVAVYTGGAFGSYLGTSWSSPAAVALFIEANQLHGSKLGWLNPTLYSLFSSTGYNTYYTPCTSGNNGAYTCTASQYNQAAGIGAPKGYALANAL